MDWYSIHTEGELMAILVISLGLVSIVRPNASRHSALQTVPMAC